MLTHKSWWDSVDSINSNVIGKYFIKFPSLLEPTTKKWNQSSNIWLQRMSILFQLPYKEKTNTELLEKYIVNRIDTNEFFVNKAIGWALRAYAYTNKKWVIRFVKDHPQLSNLSKREALKHQ
jgi:3-methyladenine DNA glycosylase AlkD